MIKNKEHETSKYVSVDRGEQARTTIYPGGFGPVTLGHYDIVERTVKMVGKLIIGVLNNKVKCLSFSAQEHVSALKEVTSSLPSIEIQSFEGLLTDFMRRSHADIVVRGPRVITDFEYELQIAQIDRVIMPEIGTILLTTNLEYLYLSPSIVKEIAEYEGDVGEFPHPVIAARVRERLEERRQLTW